MKEQIKQAEQKLMLDIVRGLVDKSGVGGLYEDFNSYLNRVEQLEKALEFYADYETNYTNTDTSCPEILADGGKLARQALGKEE